jgi:predicted nucleic acid-binding protein
MHAIDTNVLIYAFDAHDKKKHAKAKHILRAAFSGEKKLFVTNQVLAEFVSVATTKLTPSLTTEEITRFLRSIQSSDNWIVKNYTSKEVIAAAHLKKQFWDSLIAATIQEANVPLLTENTKHYEHTSITTENPFL